MEEHIHRIALVGNPNSGKSTVFNALTGLNQKVANFPGVTVDKRLGTAVMKNGDGREVTMEIIDLPGLYSLYPKSLDEQIPFHILCDPHHAFHPDLTVVVADGTNLKRNLFLCSQIVDLKIPVVLVVNMMDIVEYKGISIDLEKISARLGVPVVSLNARRGEGLKELKEAIVSAASARSRTQGDFIDIRAFAPAVVDQIRQQIEVGSNYNAFLVANNLELIPSFDLVEFKKEKIRRICEENQFDSRQMQARESMERYREISRILKESMTTAAHPPNISYTGKLDAVLTHRVWGYAVFLFVLFLIFQAIFAWSAYPMNLIDSAFQSLSETISNALPPGLFNDLLVNGILAGLNGIVVFIPQIALLFLFIAILEDTGYMARVSFLMDKLLRKFGLNGKSVIPLISGVACAVPAILGTRTIQNRKERLLTILVTPLMSCSARLPVYTLIIAMIIPNHYFWGINEQGLVLMGFYLVGFLAALGAAWGMKHLIRAKERSYFIMEMPMYRVPRWSTIGLHIVEKVKLFLFDAGKIIIAISVILWVLSSFAPGDRFEAIERKYATESTGVTQEEAQRMKKSEKLEASYAGQMGKVLEPAIAPLGFDWKIGIALITSFAAREVFVGTMSTIYSVGDVNASGMTVKDKMMAERNPETGGPRYTLAVGLSLMFFYAFAMQCMSTLAVVFRETKQLKWPLFQLFYMSGLAYIASFVTYQLLKP